MTSSIASLFFTPIDNALGRYKSLCLLSSIDNGEKYFESSSEPVIACDTELPVPRLATGNTVDQSAVGQRSPYRLGNVFERRVYSSRQQWAMYRRRPAPRWLLRRPVCAAIADTTGSSSHANDFSCAWLAAITGRSKHRPLRRLATVLLARTRLVGRAVNCSHTQYTSCV